MSQLKNRFSRAIKSLRPGDEVKSFRVNQMAENAHEQRDLGFREVRLDKITGSVGRYHDFDSKFRLKKDRSPARLERVKKAMHEGRTLPPVVLYRIKNQYFVLDGNHRVSAAKESGWSTIAAHIIEYLPTKDTLENILYREKADFEWKTGLTDLVQLSEVGQYHILLEQITEHQMALSQVTGNKIRLEQAAKDWQRTIYEPFVKIIERSPLPKAFPGRTLADLYAYITFHHWKNNRERKYGIDLDQRIPKSMEKFRAAVAEKDKPEMPEMKRVTTAFLMICVESRREDRVMEKLYAHKQVRELHFVPGEFDILLKIAVERDLLSSDSEAVGNFLRKHVRSINGVTKTQTIIPISSKTRKGYA